MNTQAPVIAGIDFAAPSPAVLRHAVHTARLNDSPVLAVHVLDSRILARRASSAGSTPAAGELEAQARRKLEEMILTHTPDATVLTEVRTGRPADELHRLIEDTGAPLLVIAANDLTKKRLGSIASRCVRSAPCDVLVLRDWQEGNFSKIVVCTDFSPASAHALERGVAQASVNGSKLEIVHVMYPPTRDFWGEVLDHDDESSVSYGDECRARVNSDMKRFLAPHAEELSAIDHRVIVLEATMPSVSLTHHIQDTGADLVILGTRGKSRLAGIFIGTNAEHLLHDANVSVLAVRD